MQIPSSRRTRPRARNPFRVARLVPLTRISSTPRPACLLVHSFRVDRSGTGRSSRGRGCTHIKMPLRTMGRRLVRGGRALRACCKRPAGTPRNVVRNTIKATNERSSAAAEDTSSTFLTAWNAIGVDLCESLATGVCAAVSLCSGKLVLRMSCQTTRSWDSELSTRFSRLATPTTASTLRTLRSGKMYPASRLARRGTSSSPVRAARNGAPRPDDSQLTRPAAR